MLICVLSVWVLLLFVDVVVVLLLLLCLFACCCLLLFLLCCCCCCFGGNVYIINKRLYLELLFIIYFNVVNDLCIQLYLLFLILAYSVRYPIRPVFIYYSI